jgi:hypothetical protein
MFLTVSIVLSPGQGPVALDVVRRVDALGRADEFFLSEASVLRAAGRKPKDVMHTSTFEWCTRGFVGTVGKAVLKCRSFRDVYPRDTIFLRRAEALGLAAMDANDPWFLPLSTAVFLLLRASNNTWAAASHCHGLLVAAFHALLVSATADFAQAPATPPSPPRRARLPVSAPAVLGLRVDPPPTPVLGRGGRGDAAAARAPPGVAEALDAANALRDFMDDAPAVAVVDAPLAAAAAAPASPVAVPLMQRLHEAMDMIPFDDPNRDVPKTSTLGDVMEHSFSFTYPGKHELERRLNHAGHSMMLWDGGKTRGPWSIVYRGETRVHALLERFGRRTAGKLSLSYTTKGAPCNAVLLMAQNVCFEIAGCLQTALRLQLPLQFECVRDRIEADRSLFPQPVRADSATGSRFSPLLTGEADIVLLSTLRMLIRMPRFSCAHCKAPCRKGLDFRRGQFHQLECFCTCIICAKVTVFFSEELDKSQQLLRRAGAFASMCSFPSTETGHRFFQFMGMPAYSKLRLFEERVLPEKMIAATVRWLGQEHFAKQMHFAKTVADEQQRVERAAEAQDKDAEIEAFLQSVHRIATQTQPVTREEVHNMEAANRLLKSLEDDAIVAVTRAGVELLKRDSVRLAGLVFGEPLRVQVHQDEDGEIADEAAPQPYRGVATVKLFDDTDTTGASGDGAHSRNTRPNGFGNAPCTYVTIISTVTGAILIQVCISRHALAAVRSANEAAAAVKFPVTAESTDEQRSALAKEQKAFVDVQPGFEYDFLGRKYCTNYIQSEAAGLDVALQILRDNIGEHAMRGGLAYDELSSCASSLRKHMPDVPKIGDPWHLCKSMRAEIEALETDKAHEGAFTGLKQLLFGAVRENFKNKAKSTEEKVAWIQQYTFPTDRVMTPVQVEAFEKLKTKIAMTFQTTRPGFATSMVESYWATHGAFWAKGLKYEFAMLEMRMTFQALHWNRLLNWNQILFAAVLPLMQKKQLPDARE